MSLLFIFTLAVGGLRAGAESTALPRAEQVALASLSTPPTPPDGISDLLQRPGIFAVWDYLPNRLTPLEHYHLIGSHITVNWSKVQNRPGVYDWSFLDDWLNSVQPTGKVTAFGISTYNGRYSNGIEALPEFLRQNPNAVVDVGGGWLVPRYWHSTYLDAYRQFIFALGERYRNDPRVEWIAIGAGMYGETWAGNPQDNNALAAAGLTSSLWIETINDIVDGYVEAFSENGLLQKPLMLQSAPFTFHRSERREIGFHAASRGVGFSLNGLYPDQEGAVFGDQSSCLYCGMYDMVLLYNQVLPTTYETYDYMLCDPTQVYWGMLNGLDKHPTYLRLNIDLFREFDPQRYPQSAGFGPDKPENLAIFDWVEHYVGVTLENTPSVWVAMREHRVPWQACWQDTPNPGPWYPQWGNYDFWLEQDDNVPGGRTVPETNDPSITEMGDNDPPYNPALPPGRAGWAVRRTDQATGNPTMFFKVDDGYLFGGSHPVTITVTYLDRGTDTWSLRYDAAGGVEQAAQPEGSSVSWVQKENSNGWRQAVFVVEDARLANGLAGDSDFLLDCGGDGDEWIHFVDVSKGGVRGGVIGDGVWWDVDGDGWQDPGEPGIPGVDVVLADDLTLSTTDAAGLYTFVNVPSGAYTIKIADDEFQPGGTLYNWSASPRDGAPDHVDSDGDETTHDATVILMAGEVNATTDFGFDIPSGCELTAALNTEEAVRSADPLSVTIRITNTGSTAITFLPLQIIYDTAYLTYGYGGQYAHPASDDNVNDGVIDWSDLTVNLGQDLTPGASFTVLVTFKAKTDTTELPEGQTVTTAIVDGARADPDGPGPLPALEPLPGQETSTGIEISQPTGLMLAGFDGVARPGTVLLTWETANELDLVGFHLLRREAGGQLEPLDEALIFAQYAGASLGATYTYRDQEVISGTTYDYVLEMVKSDGRLERYGPASV
ncbi:MAG: beta-galactosidase, partial [Chloroflexi bacterium]|nr:beta-galactosidase [Chloroflexota bacterium]